MNSSEIIDRDKSSISYPSPYKLGILSALAILVFCLSFLFIDALKPYFNIVWILMFLVPIATMVYICIKGNPETMYTNIFKTGFAYFEVVLVLSMIIAFIQTKDIIQVLGLLFYCQFTLLLVAFVALIIWIFPGHYLHYLNFNNQLKQWKFQQQLENNGKP